MGLKTIRREWERWRWQLCGVYLSREVYLGTQAYLRDEERGRGGTGGFICVLVAVSVEEPWVCLFNFVCVCVFVFCFLFFFFLRSHGWHLEVPRLGADSAAAASLPHSHSNARSKLLL